MKKIDFITSFISKEEIKEETGKQEVSRMTYVANRVVRTQVLFLIATGVLTFLFILLRVAKMLFSFTIFFVLIAIVMILIYGDIYEDIIYERHWSIITIPLAIIWISITLPIGLFFDLTRGNGRTLVMSLYLAAIYLIGNSLAQKIWRLKSNYSKKILIRKCILYSIKLIILTLVIGIFLLILSLADKDLDSRNSGNFMANPFFDLSIYIIIAGFAVVISTLLNYWMLHSLVKSKKNNINNGIPNKLISKFLVITMILMFIFFIFLELLFPPILGGDDNDSRGSSKRKSSDSDTKARKKRKPEIIERNLATIGRNQWERYLSK